MKKIIHKVKIIFSNYFFILNNVWEVGAKYLIILILIAIVGAVLPLIPLFISKEVLNILSGNTHFKNLEFWLIGLILLSGGIDFFARFADSIRGYISNFTIALVEKGINLKILDKASTIDLQKIESKEYYFKLDNARRAIGRRWDVLLLAPINLFSQFITLIALIGILSVLNKYMVLVLVIGVLPNIIIQIKIRNMMNEIYTDQLTENRKITYMETILADKRFAKEIRLFTMGKGMLKQLGELFDQRFNKINKMRKKELVLTSFTSILAFMTIGVCQIIVAKSVIRGNINLGEWSLYTGTLQSINFSLNVIINIIANSYEEKLFSSVLKEFLEIEPSIKLDEGIAFPSTCPQIIEFKNVSFKYPNTDIFILKNVSFKVQRGDKVALVGLNGAGKTTLIKLLSRLYDPVEGKILFDGVDIKKYRADDIYKLISIIFQDFNQYGFSLKENIMLSGKVKDEMKFEKSVQLTGVDKISGKLPFGYDTYMTKEYEQNGITNISGGEWQKIGIARGFYRDAPIIILDEPTSNLDPISECQLYDRFIQLCEAKTTFLISHRLSSVGMCDYILFLENGEIVEAGSHNELINKEGKYAYLFNLQADKYNVS